MNIEQARAIYQRALANARTYSGESVRERNIDIIQMYEAGATLQEIGDKHKITREAVRLILLKYSEGEDGTLKDAVHTIRQQREAEAQAQAQQKVLLWSHQNPGVPLSQAETELGYTATDLRKYLKDRAKYHPKPTAETKRGGRRRWTDDQILDMIRQCKKETGKITADAFQEWSVARGGPTKQTPTIRFGSWAQAVQQAGVSGTYAVARKRAYNEADLWAAVVEYCQSPSYNGSFEGYDIWQQTTGHRPSGALIRQRLQLSWPDMTATAFRITQGNYQGLSESWVGEVLRPRDWPTLLEEARVDINIDKLIPAAIADKGSYLTIAIYDEWAEENNKPVGVRLMSHTGKKWAEIVAPYGARVGTRGRRGTMTDDEVLAGLRRYVTEHTDLRHDSYKEWARVHHYASPTMLRKRFGGYIKALEIVRNELSSEASSN